jgi:hypothetical protein
MSMQPPAELDSPVYKAIRMHIANKALEDPSLRGRATINDDPDGPLFLFTDAPPEGEPQWCEVTTREAWPYLVEKYKPRYGSGVAVIFELPA